MYTVVVLLATPVPPGRTRGMSIGARSPQTLLDGKRREVNSQGRTD
jgi:hypothetical protein